jgi:fatty-acyl-CoA synthase
MDLSDLVARNAAFTPDKVALRYACRSLTYAALAGRIAAAARALKWVLGVGRGDRVAILAANHPDYLVLLYACARLGALLVPLNWRLAVPEQLFILADASVKVLIVQDSFAAVTAPLKEAQRDICIVRLADDAGADSSFDHLLSQGQSACRCDEPAPARLHVRDHRAAEGRRVAPGRAPVERGDEPAYA